MTTRALALAAGALAVVTALSGCSTLTRDADQAPTTSVPTAVRTPPPGEQSLETFYQQELGWSRCGPAQCAELKVPLDYAAPGKGSIEVAVLRMRATKAKQRIGSLVVNPGGPGASGVDYARAADFIVGKPVRQRFDIVGFDPRGVQRSAPVDCLPDPEMDTFLGQDPTPDDTAEEQAFAASAQALAQGCEHRSGALVAHISTVDTAKDLDILRAALGEDKLSYLGKSYGTFLGATYAGLFPKRVGRFVLDGVLPPDATSAEVAAGQAEGFERATRAWAADCVNAGDCPLGGSVDDVMAGMRSLLKRLDSRPVPISEGNVRELTEGWAATGIAEAMYDQGSWGILTDALRDVVQKDDGTGLMRLADQYARRNPDGRYTANLLEAFYAVSCLDNPDTADLKAYEQRARQASVKAPTWGPLLAWGTLPCGEWPVRSGAKPHKISAQGSAPIVVIGTTRDPATPYEWSVRLRDQLANARLLTFDGDGHTAYARSHSSCLDGAVNDYYTKGKVPPDKLRC